jgi:hypothetical protein
MGKVEVGGGRKYGGGHGTVGDHHCRISTVGRIYFENAG